MKGFIISLTNNPCAFVESYLDGQLATTTIKERAWFFCDMFNAYDVMHEVSRRSDTPMKVEPFTHPEQW